MQYAIKVLEEKIVILDGFIDNNNLTTSLLEESAIEALSPIHDSSEIQKLIKNNVQLQNKKEDLLIALNILNYHKSI